MRRWLVPGLLLIAGCGKSAPSTVDAGRPVASTPPATVASSPWLKKNADGTYAINPNAECAEVLAGAPPGPTSLGAAPGIRATLVGNDVVTVPALGLRAKIPPGRTKPAWVQVAPAEFLRQSDSEWESAYSAFLNGLVPFEALVFHTSERPWPHMVEVETLSTRLYAVTDGLEETWRSLQARLPAVGARVGCENRHGGGYMNIAPPVAITTGEHAPWKTLRAAMSVYYSDYGGTAVVELLVRRAGDVTLVLALMYEANTRPDDRYTVADALAK